MRWVSFIKEKEVTIDEVIDFYARIFRGREEEGVKATDVMKAAEFFTKYYNLLDKGSDSEGRVIIIDDIGGHESGE